MKNNNVLNDCGLHISGFDTLDGKFSKDELIHSMLLQNYFFANEVLSIRKQLDLIWFCLPEESQYKDIVSNLQVVSSRLSSLYSRLYKDNCK